MKFIYLFINNIKSQNKAKNVNEKVNNFSKLYSASSHFPSLENRNIIIPISKLITAKTNKD